MGYIKDIVDRRQKLAIGRTEQIKETGLTGSSYFEASDAYLTRELELARRLADLFDVPDLEYREHVLHREEAFSDARGGITNVLSGIGITHIAVIDSSRDVTRGNHYHPHGHQFMYLVSGAYEALSVPADQLGEEAPAVHLEWVRAGDLVYCPPGVAHAYRFTEPSLFLNLTTDPGRDPGDFDKHTIKALLTRGD